MLVKDRPFRFLALASGTAALLLGWNAQATAAHVFYSQQLPLSASHTFVPNTGTTSSPGDYSTSFADIISFGGFDPSYGTLTAVGFDISAGWSLKQDVVAGSATSFVLGSVNTEFSAALSLNGNVLTDQLKSEIWTSCPASMGAGCTRTKEDSWWADMSFQPTDLSSYIGKVAQFGLQSNIHNELAVMSVDPNASVNSKTKVSWSGLVTLTYYYDEAVAPVPEPASWTLMLGGFGLVGSALRHRRKVVGSFGQA